MPISVEQIKAARSLLGWNQKDLAQRAGLNLNTVASFENKKGVPQEDTRKSIIYAIERESIEFIDNDGVRRKPTGVNSYKGQEGFARFRRDVLKAAREPGADICISNLDERLFDKWGEGEINDSYRDEMAEIRKDHSDFKFRSLAKKNDTHFSAWRHSEYKWIPEDKFGDFPFYVYGEKTAIIVFEEDDIEIIVINHPKVTRFYRKKFEYDWEQAEFPNVQVENGQ